MLALIKTGELKNQIKKVAYTFKDSVSINHKGGFLVYHKGEYEILNDQPMIPEAFDSGDQIYIPKPPEEGPGESYLEPWPNPGHEDDPAEVLFHPGNEMANLAELKAAEETIARLKEEVKMAQENIENAMITIKALHEQLEEKNNMIKYMDQMAIIDQNRLERAERVIDVLTAKEAR